MLKPLTQWIKKETSDGRLHHPTVPCTALQVSPSPTQHLLHSKAVRSQTAIYHCACSMTKDMNYNFVKDGLGVKDHQITVLSKCSNIR